MNRDLGDSLTHSVAWQEACVQFDALADVTITELFAADAKRSDRFTRQAGGITLDASRTHLNPAALEALLGLAAQQDVFGWRDRMLAGEPVNATEGRAALHVALRLPELAAHDATLADSEARMARLVEAVHTGALQNAEGQSFTDVVNIGVGGSDLGPRLVCEALPPVAGAPRVHFIANIDPDDRGTILGRVDPERTLFIITSKTFTTFETLRNATRIRDLLTERFGATGAARQFVAITAEPARAEAFGVPAEQILTMPEWVGGRYSVWSAVGLPVALHLGLDGFTALRAGAAQMDRHFRDAPAQDNLPLWLALVGIWYGNLAGTRNHAVIPYAQSLASLPAWLQQLEMESNGKSVDRQGQPLSYRTAPAIWGAVGTNAQHAFFQWLHQGTDPTPCDFVVARRSDDPDHHALFANCLAQAATLAGGRSSEALRQQGATESLRPHRAMPGNRPSVMLFMEALDAECLGALLALYEHKVFCQAMIWDINPFDQWGVEYGKEIACELMPAVTGAATDEEALLDPAVAAMIRRYRNPS